MGRVGIDDFESLGSTKMDYEGYVELTEAADQCTYVFIRDDGWPSGVIMSYLAKGNRFWLTSVLGRSQVTGTQKDPRVALVIDNRGTPLEGRRMVTIRGRATLHTDRETKDWFYPALATVLAPTGMEAYIRLIDSPNRVIIEFEPLKIGPSHDSRKMAGDGRGGELTPPVSGEEDLGGR